ncbi:Prolyl endopeptidase-like [Channa argus]|uniref:Prolyl endopeptidase n=1 Tax=Channa argus TaxID=215402 RepID=A0A6G1R0R0_CHAAH|nr:Prolyl endopeptidase-like [Channa argus]
MAAVSSPLCARLFTPSGLRFLFLAVYKNRTRLFVSVQRFYTSGTSTSSDDHLSSGLERYKDLQKYFYKRLKATYYRFSDIPDRSVVCGHHHVYFFEDDGIYRTDTRQSKLEPEQVLNLGQVSRGDEKTVLENEERKQRVQWTIQRIRLSPQEKHLAAALKSIHKEEQSVFVEVALSRDRQILSINCNSRTSSEVLLIDTTTSQLKPFLVQSRQPDLLYHVEHWKRCLIILANTGPGQEYEVVQAPLSEPNMVSWVPLFAPSPGTSIKDMDVVGDQCVLVARTPANELILIIVPLTHTKEAYILNDGTLVPMTLLHVKPVESLRQVPLLVHVYGAYGREVNMEFCPEKRFLLEQGWALAYCHVRGGGERGLYWQRQAQVAGKPKTVEDLQACIQHLFSLGVSSPSLTALTACSAGAVAVGALCQRHPHMIRAVTLQAPFLDVLGTMEDPNLPLTLEDREEWGDPVGNPEHRLAIASYCPLHNITPQSV